MDNLLRKDNDEKCAKETISGSERVAELSTGHRTIIGRNQRYIKELKTVWTGSH